MSVEVSIHAEKRMRERMGLNKRSIQRMAERAFYDGIKHSQTKGNLNKWITSQFFAKRTASNIRIYGNMVFIFSGNILVTVYCIPRNLFKNIDSMIRR